RRSHVPIAVQPPCVLSSASLLSNALLCQCCSTRRLPPTTLGRRPARLPTTPPGRCHDPGPSSSRRSKTGPPVASWARLSQVRRTLSDPFIAARRRTPTPLPEITLPSQPIPKTANTPSLLWPPCAKSPESPPSLTAGSFNKRFSAGLRAAH